MRRLDWKRGALPQQARTILTLDAHAAGEPLRIITGGLPPIEGGTMLARREWMRTHLDDIRRALMWEPRGHENMYGCVVVPPLTDEADLGVLFFHNEGYSTMCGHGIIALVTALLETGTIAASGAHTAVALDTPAGLVRATAHLAADGHVERVSFVNVSSFVLYSDLDVTVPEVGHIVVDVAFGGAFYAILPAATIGLSLELASIARLVAAGAAITRAVGSAVEVAHPLEPDLGFLYGTIFTGPPEVARHHSRNLCIFADGEVDRSPTGTGVSARLALLAAREEIEPGQQIAVESILGAGSVFTGRVLAPARIGGYAGVVPEVSGTAHLTGRHEFVLDPRDPLGAGFLVRQNDDVDAPPGR